METITNIECDYKIWLKNRTIQIMYILQLCKIKIFNYGKKCGKRKIFFRVYIVLGP